MTEKQECVPIVPSPAPPSAAKLDQFQISKMLSAGREIRECYRVLERGGLNVVGEILRGQGTFFELEHYPEDEVLDEENCSRYYYHAHRDKDEEHGHFHTFIDTGLLKNPPDPLDYSMASETWPKDGAAIAHLIGISMDDWGYPKGLFTTNRWVTDETWYSADTIIGLLPQFLIDHANPSWPVNRWITSMFRLFQPHIVALLEHRDISIGLWQQDFPDSDILEERRLEIIGYLPINVDEWVNALEKTKS
ncbi:DUF6969 family protein [Acidihalobacter prosperus]